MAGVGEIKTRHGWWVRVMGGFNPNGCGCGLVPPPHRVSHPLPSLAWRLAQRRGSGPNSLHPPSLVLKVVEERQRCGDGGGTKAEDGCGRGPPASRRTRASSFGITSSWSDSIRWRPSPPPLSPSSRSSAMALGNGVSLAM
jgi:hypothetical protein